MHFNRNIGLAYLYRGLSYFSEQNYSDSLNDISAAIDLKLDENFEIYAYLKTKKQVSSIPVILAWKKGNTMIGPDYSVVGANKKQYRDFLVNLQVNKKYDYYNG